MYMTIMYLFFQFKRFIKVILNSAEGRQVADTSSTKIPDAHTFSDEFVYTWSRIVDDMEVILVGLLISEQHPEEYTSLI